MKRIDVLPDDVLLEIFDFNLKIFSIYGVKRTTERWQSLAHVCRRWRNLVFASPRRLNLQLFCTPKTPARDLLDVWPAFPLIVTGNTTSSPLSGTDNIIAALGQSSRVCRVDLSLTRGQLERVLAAMQVPFPELTDLRLIAHGETLPDTPDSFLDGSAPRLRNFLLDAIPFPGLPKLLLSATQLVVLRLFNIQYISPEPMVALLSVMSSLTSLSLGFPSPESPPDWETQSLPPPKRSIIPALEFFDYRGDIEYLEDLVPFIDAPQLEIFRMNFIDQIDFDTPQLAQFINRTPKLTKRDVHVQFDDYYARVVLRSEFKITISCREPDWQLLSVSRVCNSSLHPLSTVEDLYIEHEYSKLVLENDANENILWLQLLLPFTAVKNLYLSNESAIGFTVALQDLVGGRITEVLPSLQNIFVEGGLEPQFAQLLFDPPISISVWDKKR